MIVDIDLDKLAGRICLGHFEGEDGTISVTFQDFDTLQITADGVTIQYRGEHRQYKHSECKDIAIHLRKPRDEV